MASERQTWNSNPGVWFLDLISKSSSYLIQRLVSFTQKALAITKFGSHLREGIWAEVLCQYILPHNSVYVIDEEPQGSG